MRPSHFALFLAISIAVAFLSPDSSAQIPPTSDTTSTPIPGAGHNYLGGPAETINPANGSVSVRISAITPPGRGITLPFAFAYDSNGANYLGIDPTGRFAWLTSYSLVSQGGWSNTGPMLSLTQIPYTVPSGDGEGVQTCGALVNFVFQDPFGNRHNLDLSTTGFTGKNVGGDCTQGYGQFLQGGEGPIIATATSSGYGRLQVPPVTIIDGSGTVFNFPSQIQFSTDGSATVMANSVVDRNGNTVTIHPPTFSSPPFNFTDTAGRTVLSDTGVAVSPETVTLSGLGAPYTLYWTTLSTPTFTGTITNLFNQCTTPVHLDSETVVSQINLPNGQSFTFGYDTTYGMVNKITYPSGGYVRYVWGFNSQSEAGVFPSTTQGVNCIGRYDTPAITDRYVSFDGTHEVLHQHFAYSTTWGTSPSWDWTSKQTTVTTTDLVRNASYQTAYTYAPIPADVPPNTGGPITESVPLENTISYYDTNGALLKTVSKGWVNQRMLASQQTTFPSGPASLSVYCYNNNELETEHDNFDFGTAAPTLPACASGVPSGTVAGPLLRKTVTSYATSTAMTAAHVIDKASTVIVYDGSSNKAAETDYTYDNPLGTATSGIVQHGTGCNCGNLTKESRWVNSSGTTLNTTYTNDDTGQRLSMTDPRSNQTTYSYTDSYSSGTPPGPTNAYLTTVTHPQTSGVNHIEKFSYAYSSGEVTSSTDQNNLVTSYKYVDNLARLTETDSPDGDVTTIAYNDNDYNPSTPSPSVTTTKKINTSTNLATVSAMDGLGHVVRNELTSDPQGTVYTDTTYDGLARVYTVSNPYRSGTDLTTSSGTTTYTYDALGRKLTETYPDNSVLTTAYCAGSTLVTDPTGRWRRSRVDGLGRLVEVDEPNAPGATVASTGCPGTGEPIWVTSYTLDTLGNLKRVVQNGSHQRNFTFDWASRLLTANNPETGTITYNYDSDTNCASPNSFAGLLVSKVDARGIRTCAQYDALNRETVLNYSNGDPTITTTYDQSVCLGLSACQNIGQPTSRTDAAGSEAWSYQVDATNLRTIHVNQRTTSNITKTSTYYFDLASNVTQAVYPTGRVVNYTFDAANRPSTAVDGSNGITYAAGPDTSPGGTCLADVTCYTPQGTFYALSIGETASFTGLNLTHIYNSRLQPQEFKASSTGGNAIDITYNFVDPVSGKNAGHVYGTTNNLDTTRSQTFSYDQLNRLTAAQTTSTWSTSPAHCWGETFNVDPWGNLQSIAATTNSNYTGCSLESGFSTTADGNNHLPTLSYDSSGNTQGDGTYTYTWDAESQLKSAGGVNYTYDGDGRRVSKSNGKLYWYGSGGDILAETDASGNTTAEYIFFGGKRIAMLPAGGNPIYYVEDLLGTSRVITTNTGVVCYDADFYPYGAERPYTNTCPQNYKFEGKERDTETGNDDFGARYYSNRFGRWLSADWSSVPVPVPYANLTNPQTLNLYSMVADDPESFADLDGHEGSGHTPSGDADSGSIGARCRATFEGDCDTSAPGQQLSEDPEQSQATGQNAQANATQRTVTVNLNVIYDNNADLSKADKAKFENETLKTAVSDYGNIGVKLNDTSKRGNPGSMDDTDITNVKFTGIEKGAINVIVSDHVPGTTDSAGSKIVNGTPITVINIKEASKGELTHELAHHFLGHSAKPLPENPIKARVINAAREISVMFASGKQLRDGARAFAQQQGP